MPEEVKPAKAKKALDASADPAKGAAPKDKASPSTPRKIPGNLPYMTAHGTLKRALERSIGASRPEKFNADFMENILKLSGGGARATIPILKRMGFLTSDAIPTDLYAKFRTSSGRSAAALQALKNAFPEIFKRSEYAHTVDDSNLRDIIVEITGLKSNEPVTQAIKSTFNALKSFVTPGAENSQGDGSGPSPDDGGACAGGCFGWAGKWSWS
ncbi:DUF5343 domain-containing protein [Xanthobacter autotrophicus DSM 431]|uniref:DUF5343 domain-containing protein n=1 Tax=Xanthobacter nonsaccharivorans TaxID=3119912 RepID=UPI00372C05B7